MSDIIQSLAAGLAMGAIYALIALGINIIFSTSSIVNFAFGDLAMISTFISFSLMSTFHVPPVLAVLLSIAAGMAISLLMQVVVIRPIGIHNLENRFEWLLILLGISIIFKNLARIIWGPRPRAYPNIFNDSNVTIGNVHLSTQELWILIVAIAIMVIIEWMNRSTRLGWAIQATSMNKEAASLIGINPLRIISYTFLIGGGLAAVTGILIGPVTFLSPEMGTMVGLKGFSAALLGGVGSPRGGIAGGFMIGICEALASLFLPADYAPAIAFGILILVLLIKPTGLFGRTIIEKV
ncbi:MAG: branched-chain amino acid ABC transporter permease [Alicyclobacillaceae bacterium]|nr:branched-chain amino acid ABC transporter permease [Alicyclobacillaceae bacterium]